MDGGRSGLNGWGRSGLNGWEEWVEWMGGGVG